ncbi:MAG: hypothetical protein B5M52_07695 [Helicobacteraceae bacterium 4484_230]|nr:MAG: hypothetical protein B5M52_07695 [Helicobacteraceae bacterium 4484_230]
MKAEHVPQDHISTYADNKKALYATDENGHYSIVSSSGWEVEEEATKQALYELKRLADEALEKVERKEASPLLYHMYAQRMDLQVLAQTTGLFQWRIRRHFKPEVFAKLSDSFLERYSGVLGISVDDLKKIPSGNSNG